MKAMTTSQVVKRVADIKAARYVEAQSRRQARAFERDSAARLAKAKKAVKAAMSR